MLIFEMKLNECCARNGRMFSVFAFTVERFLCIGRCVRILCWDAQTGVYSLCVVVGGGGGIVSRDILQMLCRVRSTRNNDTIVNGILQNQYLLFDAGAGTYGASHIVNSSSPFALLDWCTTNCLTCSILRVSVSECQGRRRQQAVVKNNNLWHLYTSCHLFAFARVAFNCILCWQRDKLWRHQAKRFP